MGGSRRRAVGGGGSRSFAIAQGITQDTAHDRGRRGRAVRGGGSRGVYMYNGIYCGLAYSGVCLYVLVNVMIYPYIKYANLLITSQ